MYEEIKLIAKRIESLTYTDGLDPVFIALMVELRSVLDRRGFRREDIGRYFSNASTGHVGIPA